MHDFHPLRSVLLVGLFTVGLSAEDFNFKMCNGEKCENCPASVINEGPPYSENQNSCITYSSDDIFKDAGYDTLESGTGYKVYFDVDQIDSGCNLIVRSPASTDLPGCGTIMASFQSATCSPLQIQESFMLQTCCGDQCDKAGVGRRSSTEDGWDFLAGRGSVSLLDSNGAKIEPLEVGAPPEVRARETEEKETQRKYSMRHDRRDILRDATGNTAEPILARAAPERSNDHRNNTLDSGSLEKRWTDQKSFCGQNTDDDPPEIVRTYRGGCECGSYEAVGKRYTKPADNVQIVSSSSYGPEISIMTTRSHESTYSFSQSIGFGDIFTMGLGMEQSFTDTASDSEEYKFQVPEGQSGRVGFTAKMQCEAGKGICDGEEVKGESCWPVTRDGLAGGRIDGFYNLIVES